MLFGQIHFDTWKNTSDAADCTGNGKPGCGSLPAKPLDKYIFDILEIHLVIWRNTFSYLGKYILIPTEIYLMQKLATAMAIQDVGRCPQSNVAAAFHQMQPTIARPVSINKLQNSYKRKRKKAKN